MNAGKQQVCAQSTRLILGDERDGDFCWSQDPWRVFIFSRRLS